MTEHEKLIKTVEEIKEILLKAAADKDAKLDYTMAKVAPEFSKGEVLKSIFIFILQLSILKNI